MSKHTIDGFITWRHAAWMSRPEVGFLTYDPKAVDGDFVVIRPHSFEVEVPDDFDPRSAQVAVLREKREKAAAAFSAYVAEIDASISKLLAIE